MFVMSGKVDPDAVIGPEVKLGRGCSIAPNARIIGAVKLRDQVSIDYNTIVCGPALVGGKTYIGPNSIVGFPVVVALRGLVKKELEGKRSALSVSIGERCLIRSNCVIYQDVTVGDDVVFGHNVMLREKVRVGRNTLVGTNVIIDGNSEIGECVSIQTGAYIAKFTVVGDSVFLGPSCSLVNDKFLGRRRVKLEGPIIKRGAGIGANATVFPGITVGEGSIVGAGAVVNKDVPSGVIVAGVPAERIGEVPKDWSECIRKRFNQCQDL